MLLKKKINFFKNLFNNIRTGKIIFLVFILYLFLRLLPVIINHKSIFIDEIWSIEKFENFSWYQNLVQSTPLHYLISKLFLVFLPLNIYSLVIPYIIISLVLFIILLKNKFIISREAYILFLLFFTISLPAIYYSSFIGHYGPFLLFSVLSHIYLIKCLKNKLRHIIKFFLFSFLTVMSHQVGIFFLIINLVFLCFYKRRTVILNLTFLCIVIIINFILILNDEVRPLITKPEKFYYQDINTFNGLIYNFKKNYELSDSINLSYSLEKVLDGKAQNNYFIYNYFFFFKAVISYYLFGQISILSSIYFIFFLIGFVSAAIKFNNNKNNEIELVNINRNYCLFLIIFTFTFLYIFRFRHTFDEKYLIYLNIPTLFFFSEGIIIFLRKFKEFFKFKRKICFYFFVFIFLDNISLYNKANSLVYTNEKYVYSFQKAFDKIDNNSLIIVRDTDYNEFFMNKKIFNYKFQILAEGDFINLEKKIDLNKKIFWVSIPDINSMKIYSYVNVIKNIRVGNINIYEISIKEKTIN
jgi:hypothetical protein